MAGKSTRKRRFGMGNMTNGRMFAAMIFGAVFRRRSRALMAVIASTVGAATLFCLAAVCIAVPQQMSEDMRSYGANLVVTAVEKDSSAKAGIAEDMVTHTTEMIEAKAPAKLATYRYDTVRINAASYMMAGIDPTAVKTLNHHWSVEGAWPSEGQVLVGTDVASALGLKVGSDITIAYRSADNTGAAAAAGSGGGTPSGGAGSTPSATGTDGRVSTDIMEEGGVSFRVAGIVDTGGSEDQIVYATTKDLDALAGSTRGADVLEYSVDASSKDLDSIVRSINAMSSMGVKAQTVTKITTSNTKIITMLQTLFWLVSVVVLVLTFVGVGTTMTSIVSQRRNEIGLRKALGAPSSRVGTEFYAESALYGLLGGVLGTGLGYCLAWMLCSVVFGHDLRMNWPLALAAVICSMLIAVVATIRPVRKASGINPAVVLREE
jgi:putative ABC transport system permease protein